MKKTALNIFALLLLVSCANKEEAATALALSTSAFNEITKAAWMEGSWQGSSPEGIAFESWTKTNDSTYAGKGGFIVGKDTVSSETMSLEQRGGKLLYIPTVKQQNEGKPVSFAMTKATEDELVFENPAHDFPQKIRYQKINADSVVAEISGNMDGQPSSQKFPLKRMK